MSYSSQIKDELAQKTEAEFNNPKTKLRPRACCMESFNEAFGLFGGEKSENESRPLCANCAGWFLRGAFLAAGSISDPETSYHLEIAASEKDFEKRLTESLSACGFDFKTVKRAKKRVFYLKDSEKIEDFLTTVGLQDRAMELMQLKIEKTVKNRINRINNSDGANLQRTVDFTAKIKEAIETLKAAKEYEKLPDSIKKTAALRLKYPGASLTELCSLSDEHITKSGLNHRFKKLLDGAESVKRKNTEEKQ